MSINIPRHFPPNTRMLVHTARPVSVRVLVSNRSPRDPPSQYATITRTSRFVVIRFVILIRPSLPPNPRLPNIRAAVLLLAGKFSRRGNDSKEEDTRRNEEKESTSKLSSNTLFPLPSLKLLLSVLAARFIKIEGSSQVPLPSRKSAETSPYASFLPFLLFSLPLSSRWQNVMTLPDISFERRQCAPFHLMDTMPRKT